ncbi:carbamoyltransferase HypF, partial [bacterium]|nr:carbamoyltransferase HypF [bacterium]
PGGDAAIRHPYRVALAHLHAAGENDLSSVGRRLFTEIDCSELDLVVQQIEKNLNCIATSSAGRLFDAVSAILGVCHEISYEAQAAIELESLIDQGRAEPEGGHPADDVSGGAGEASEPHYPYELIEAERGFVVDTGPTVLAVLADVLAGTPREIVSRAFHNTVVRFATDACSVIARASGIDTVALSGGVFQNRYLLTKLVTSLETGGFRVLLNREVPMSDGGVSLGQAVVAGERAARGLE